MFLNTRGCLGTPNAIIMAAFQLAWLLSCRVKSTHPLDPCVFQALKSQLSPALHPSRILPRLQSQCPGIRTVPPMFSWLQFPQYSVSPLKCSVVWKEWLRKRSSNFNTRAINQIMPDYSASILEEREERGQAENEFGEGGEKRWWGKVCQKIIWPRADVSRDPWGHFLRVMQWEGRRKMGRRWRVIEKWKCRRAVGEPIVKELLQHSTPASGTACISLGVD